MASRGIGTIVDTLVLWICSHFIFGGGYWATYVISPLISFEFAVMSNFLCSYFWIWSNRVSEKSRSSFWRHFVAFNISSVAGFVVKMIFLLLFEGLFGWHVVVCNLAALAISGVLNYFLSESVVFRKVAPRPEHELLSIEELGR
ncbi:MAG: GtrA family protein, partial [Tidjanibacter sp.]|nr:GtrA family protein [Tidjanibacter sp.]